MSASTAEHLRLADSIARKADWKHWGPYVSDRAWATVREDTSPDCDSWNSFPHNHAISRAYRWSEDGIGGVCNRHQHICLAFSFWNEKDSMLKERFFGVTGGRGGQGNHGEDVKEYYFHLDNTPTHSYMKMLYKYPQAAFPYEEIVRENQARTRKESEYELIDTGVFTKNGYFDIFIEYAKADQEDILCRVTAINRGHDRAPLHILPTLWYRNTWSWGINNISNQNTNDIQEDENIQLADDRFVISAPIDLPLISATSPDPATIETTAEGEQKILIHPSKPVLKKLTDNSVESVHRILGRRFLYVDDHPSLLFTENNTNKEKLFNQPNESKYVKDGINDAVVHNQLSKVNPDNLGSKVAAHYKTDIAPGQSYVVRLRFTDKEADNPFADFDDIFAKRKSEADEFYSTYQQQVTNEEDRAIQRQAWAGLMWSKQFYHYNVESWLLGDRGDGEENSRVAQPNGWNNSWKHVYCADVISMPDKWEYPWFAAWDLAFHCVPVAMIDPEWAQRQMILMLREWYMHQSGQIPAYEYNFSDVNPPVHAWGCLHVYKWTAEVLGTRDVDFLEKVFHKLLLNFQWWVNRKDSRGHNVFEGGFLGLDNIGVFDRSAELPTGGFLQQADATSWMAMYCLNMLTIALEVAMVRPTYEDVATKFLEHFIYICHAISNFGEGKGLWDTEDGFFYDMLVTPDGKTIPLKIQSLVGLIPLCAVSTYDIADLQKLPKFWERFNWFRRFRPHLADGAHEMTRDKIIFSLVRKDKLTAILNRMLDEDQFLSPHGVRSLSKAHKNVPFIFYHSGQAYRINYEPGDSQSLMFGGNSNWRGPVWYPINFLLVESLQKYHQFYGDSLSVPFPTKSNQMTSLDKVSHQLAQRLISLFRRDQTTGLRPFYGESDYFNSDPNWKDYVLFYEYFHGDTGLGQGASHQTGWTALVAELISRVHKKPNHDVY